MGHSFELYTYGPLTVPAGVVLKEAEKIIPLAEVFYYENPQTGSKDLGPFSDLFRFKLLSERGGWWSDVDTICLSPDIPAVEKAWAQELPEFNPSAVGTSQIAMPKADQLTLRLYSRCLELSQTKFPQREALGPHLLSSTIREMHLTPNVFGTAETFYPVRWIEMFKLWLPQFRDEIEERSRNALFLPIYQSFPQYIGLTNLGKLPPRGSFLADICRAYSPAVQRAEHYLAEEIIAGTRAFFRSNSTWAVEELKAVTRAEVGAGRSDYRNQKKVAAVLGFPLATPEEEA